MHKQPNSQKPDVSAVGCQTDFRRFEKDLVCMIQAHGIFPYSAQGEVWRIFFWFVPFSNHKSWFLIQSLAAESIQAVCLIQLIGCMQDMEKNLEGQINEQRLDKRLNITTIFSFRTVPQG